MTGYSYRSGFAPGPLSGRAARLTRERKAREYAKRDKLKEELAAELSTPLNGHPVDRKLRAKLQRDIGVALHMQTWFHAYPWKRT